MKYRLIFTDLFSDLGNQFVRLKLLDKLVFQDESALINMLLMCMVDQGAYVVFSPYASICIDRLGEKKLLMFSNFGKCFLLCAIFFLPCRWTILPAYAGFVIFSLFFNISRCSLIPGLIEKSELIYFNSLNDRIGYSVGFFSFPIIGWLISNTGHGFSLGLAAALFLFSILVGSRLPVLEKTDVCFNGVSRSNGSIRRLLIQCKESLNNTPILKFSIIVLGALLFGSGTLHFGLLMLFKESHAGNIFDWSLIMTSFQAGSFIATTVLPKLSSAFKHKKIISVTLLSVGGAMAVLVHADADLQIAAAMMIVGIGSILLHLIIESLVQQKTSQTCMVATISFLSFFRGASFLLTAILSALALNIISSQSLILAGSLVIVSTALFVEKRQDLNF